MEAMHGYEIKRQLRVGRGKARSRSVKKKKKSRCAGMEAFRSVSITDN